MKGCFALVAGLALALISAGAAQASVFSISYFEVSEASGYYGAGGDFGTCCSSPPATLEGIALGASLSGGLPVNTSGNVIDENFSGQILWWTPSVANGVSYTGSGAFAADGNAYSMYAPSSSGGNDASYFETAILSGAVHGTGGDVTLNVGSDDDLLVYLNGKYVGGEPGVHGYYTTPIDLGVITGTDSIELFYADRAQVGAYLSVGVSGGTISGVPELSTWAMLLLGFAGLGFAGRKAARKAVAV